MILNRHAMVWTVLGRKHVPLHEALADEGGFATTKNEANAEHNRQALARHLCEMVMVMTAEELEALRATMCVPKPKA